MVAGCTTSSVRPGTNAGSPGTLATSARGSQDTRIANGSPGHAPREQTADQQVQHVLNRLAFGPRPGDVQAVRAMGVDAWINRQLSPERIDNSTIERVLEPLRSLRLTGGELIDAYPPPGALQQRLAADGSLSAADSQRIREMGRQSYVILGEISTAKIARAVASERQLQEVMVDFWENHFNVFAGKDRTRYFIPEYSERVIRPHAMGSFRELLGAVAKSPAMLYYLDNWQSQADSGRPVLMPNGRVLGNRPQNPQQRRRGLNENYARELMELHTLGVDGGYTQGDVVEVARALTGWTLDRGANGGEFLFRPFMHDAGSKTILGQYFPAGRGIEDGERVLDMLASHPSTARFIAFKLARRFVSDTPSAALVDRAAATFTRTKGDIGEVLRTIILSSEFFASSSYRAKVKSPFEVVVSTLRVMGAQPDATPRLAQLVSRLGQPIYGHQAPNGYPETGDAWMNTGAILNRINFGLAAATGRVPGVRLVDWPATKELASLPREQQVDGVIRELFGGYASSDTRQVLVTGTNPFLQAKAGADTLMARDSSVMDAANDMGNSMSGDDARRRRAGGAQAGRRGNNNRQQQAAGREAVRPGAGQSLGQAFGTIPDPRGFAQVVGLALGAPEFQRR
jgi:uncharacterized protein (DUF1800 family)